MDLSKSSAHLPTLPVPDEDDEDIPEDHDVSGEDMEHSFDDEPPFGLDEPNLEEYLGFFGLPDVQQIAICRTYANYLSAKSKPTTRGPYKKFKGPRRTGTGSE